MYVVSSFTHGTLEDFNNIKHVCILRNIPFTSIF
jgi:hypothetical protein